MSNGNDEIYAWLNNAKADASNIQLCIDLFFQTPPGPGQSEAANLLWQKTVSTYESVWKAIREASKDWPPEKRALIDTLFPDLPKPRPVPGAGPGDT